MNLYFRLLRILFKSYFATIKEPLEISRISFKAWPFDCDINMHMTNARYFSLGDLSRIFLMGEKHVLFKVLKRKWMPVVQSQDIQYFKPIKPFQHFEITTNIIYWDEKYWYIEHKFLSNDTLFALLRVRGVFLKGKTIIPFQEITKLNGAEIESPPKPDFI